MDIIFFNFVMKVSPSLLDGARALVVIATIARTATASGEGHRVAAILISDSRGEPPDSRVVFRHCSSPNVKNVKRDE
jgi:hypothetical protein